MKTIFFVLISLFFYTMANGACIINESETAVSGVMMISDGKASAPPFKIKPNGKNCNDEAANFIIFWFPGCKKWRQFTMPLKSNSTLRVLKIEGNLIYVILEEPGKETEKIRLHCSP